MDDNSKRILVVDDQPPNIQILNEILKTEYLISVAVKGRVALDIAAGDNPPDLILLDVIMPEMDGYEVCKRLKENPATRDIPVLFITGGSESEKMEKGLALGGLDYIIKPVMPAIVKARVKNYLELIRLRREAGQVGE